MIHSIVEVKDDKAFNDMAVLIAEHEYDEIDCGIDKYLTFLKNYLPLMEGEFFRAWVLYIDDKPVGYISGIYSPDIRHEISIHDHYINTDYRSVKCDKELIRQIVGWAEEKKVKRISWTSSHPAKMWHWIMKNMTKKKVQFKQLYFVSCEVLD